MLLNFESCTRAEGKYVFKALFNYEDLWKIPRMVEDINPKYKFYLRCYGRELFPTEIVLYAIEDN